MTVEIGTEAAQFPEKEYINGIFVVVHLWYRLKVGEIDPPPPPSPQPLGDPACSKRVGPIGNTFCQVGPRGNQGIYRGVTSATK